LKSQADRVLAKDSLRIIYMSGYLEYNRGNEEFLEPFSRDTVVSKVAEAPRSRQAAKSAD
jgi:hypothetical protein